MCAWWVTVESFTCTGHRNQGRHPAPPLSLYFPGELASSSVQRRRTSVLQLTNCLQNKSWVETQITKKLKCHNLKHKKWVSILNYLSDFAAQPPWSHFPLPDDDFLDLVLLDEDFLVLLKLYTLAFCGLGFWRNNTKHREIKQTCWTHGYSTIMVQFSTNPTGVLVSLFLRGEDFPPSVLCHARFTFLLLKKTELSPIHSHKALQ